MKHFISFVSTIITSILANAQAGTSHWNIEKGLALQGFDAVAYHTRQKAARGVANWEKIIRK